MLNIIKVVDDISSCELLTDEVKLKALDDLLKMVKDERYAEKVGFDLFEVAGIFDERREIAYNHYWDQSDLGSEFWEKVNHIVY